MSHAFSDIGIVDRQVRPDRVIGLFAGPVADADAVVLTGADGGAWWEVAVAADDLVFAFWTAPTEPVIVYGGDQTTLDRRLATGTVMILAGGGMGLEINPAWSRASDVPAAAQRIFGDDVILSTEDPATAAARIAGPPAEAGTMLGLLGATVTILVGPGSSIGRLLAADGRRPGSCLTLPERSMPGVLLGAAWTRALGAFQVRFAESIDGLSAIRDGSLGDVAAVAGPDSVRERAASLLTDAGEGFDIVAGADPGGITSFVTDLVTAFALEGDVVVTGSAVPARTVMVLRGDAAASARHRLDMPGVERDRPVFGPVAGEDAERYEAHQWVGAMRRAKDALDPAWPAGGPTLASEARATGLVWPPDDDAPVGRIDGSTLARIVRARGWQVIDPELPPVLDRVLSAARDQLRGSDAPIPAATLRTLGEWARRPGFWPDLLSAVEPPEPGRLVIPYPPASVEILRAAVASQGDAERLRQWLGPVKTAIFRGFGERSGS